MEITEQVTREALWFSPLQMACPCWAPITRSSALRRVQNGNTLCYHIFGWPVCLSSVSTCCEPKCWPWPPSLTWSWRWWRLWLTWAVKPQDAYSSGREWNGRAAEVAFDVAGGFCEKEEWWFSKRILPTFYEIPISIQNVKPCLVTNFFALYVFSSSSSEQGLGTVVWDEMYFFFHFDSLRTREHAQSMQNTVYFKNVFLEHVLCSPSLFFIYHPRARD